MEKRKIVLNDGEFEVLKPSRYGEGYNQHGKRYSWRGIKDYIVGMNISEEGCQFDFGIPTTEKDATDWVNKAMQYECKSQRLRNRPKKPRMVKPVILPFNR